MEEYGNNILIVDSDSITGGAFQELCEVTKYVPIKSNKRFKFIILSEISATSPSKILEIKNKIIEGYSVIYPQTERVQLNNFLKSFSVNLENNSYKVNGCTLRRDLNTTALKYYIQAIPSYSNVTQQTVDYIKSEIVSAVTCDLPYKDKSEFLGVYISKAVYKEGNFNEVIPFSAKAAFDTFDTFNSDKDKKFTLFFDDKKQSITYSTCYEISNTEMEFFYAYIILVDFYGKITAVPLKNSAFTHSGIAHTLTEEISIYSGVKAFADISETLKITFKFV